MKMLKRSFLPPQVVFFILLFLGSSSYFFSANPEFPEINNFKDQENLLRTSEVGEQGNPQFDSILPVQKTFIYTKGVLSALGDLRNCLISHTSTSQSYIKRSRYIFPAFGVKEVIFPFHVFL